MRVALVHDDLVQWGGAERVLLALSELFPDAPIYTSVFDQSNSLIWEKFKDKKIVTSFLQQIPGWKFMYKQLLPFYPLGFELFDFSEFDVVISQTTRFAKCIITKPEQSHICYSHTPPRFLWHFPSDNTPAFLEPLLVYLRGVDRISAQRVDHWIAGSGNCQQRLRKIYHVPSKVVVPFVDLEEFRDLQSFDGGYFLLISRLNDYKRVDLAVEVFNENQKELKIIGDGPQRVALERQAKDNIQFLGSVSEQLRLNLLAGCRGLIVTAEEDFGLTPLEAHAVGKPVVAYANGGARETIIENKTGIFFFEQTAQSLKGALEEFEKSEFKKASIQAQATKFSKLRFLQQFEKAVKTVVE